MLWRRQKTQKLFSNRTCSPFASSPWTRQDGAARPTLRVSAGPVFWRTGNMSTPSFNTIIHRRSKIPTLWRTRWGRKCTFWEATRENPIFKTRLECSYTLCDHLVYILLSFRFWMLPRNQIIFASKYLNVNMHNDWVYQRSIYVRSRVFYIILLPKCEVLAEVSF